MQKLPIYLALIFSLFFPAALSWKALENITTCFSGYRRVCNYSTEKESAFKNRIKETVFHTKIGKMEILFYSREKNRLEPRKTISMTGGEDAGLVADPKAISKLQECCKNDGNNRIHRF